MCDVVWCVFACCQLSRDFGCPMIKNECPALKPEPHVGVVELSKHDEFLVIGSDGLFEVHRDPNQFMHLIKETLRATGSVDDTCKQIVSATVASPFSNDNVTMLLIVFNQDGVVTGNAGAAGGRNDYARTFRQIVPGKRPGVAPAPELKACECLGDSETMTSIPNLQLPSAMLDGSSAAAAAESMMAAQFENGVSDSRNPSRSNSADSADRIEAPSSRGHVKLDLFGDGASGELDIRPAATAGNEACSSCQSMTSVPVSVSITDTDDTDSLSQTQLLSSPFVAPSSVAASEVV